MMSAKRLFNRKPENCNCFELFGFDFMIDSKGNPFLIEVNTNPSLDQTNNYLTKLIERMINDLLRVTVDKLYFPYK